MKILFIIHSVSYCGAERVLALIANELCERGNDVYILTDPNDVKYPLKAEITILDAYLNSRKYAVNSTIGKIKRQIAYNCGFYKTLRKYVEEINPDHVVSFMGFFIWQLLPFRHKYRITISEHSAMDRSINRMRNFEKQKLAERFYCQTVLTQADKDYLGSKRSNVVVMNNPLSFEPISEERYEKSFDRRHNILFCGSLDRYRIKGLDNMIRAFALATYRCPDLKLDIAGNGGEESMGKMRQLATDLRVADAVNFLGFKEDVAAEMESHSMLVVPSRSEGFGMVVIEAMASGCPVISYALSGPSEIIKDGVDGILVENQNIDKLAEAICKLAESSSLRKELGRNGIRSVERFSLENIVNKWETILTNE